MLTSTSSNEVIKSLVNTVFKCDPHLRLGFDLLFFLLLRIVFLMTVLLYAVYVVGENNKRLYFCGKGDGQAYVLKDTLLGAALWPNLAIAQKFIEAMSPIAGPLHIEIINTAGVQHKDVSLREARDLEQKLNS